MSEEVRAGTGARMLEVHIPSVGPEAEAPKQSPEKGHMVSGGTGWEGVQGPPISLSRAQWGPRAPDWGVGALPPRPSGDSQPKISGR